MLGLPLTILLACLAEIALAATGRYEATASVDFSATIEPGALVSIEHLGQGVYETVAVSGVVQERRITASMPQRFALTAESFELEPEGARLALQ